MLSASDAVVRNAQLKQESPVPRANGIQLPAKLLNLAKTALRPPCPPVLTAPPQPHLLPAPQPPKS